MKAKLLNTVSRSQIGYYQNGEWQAKIMFNFKLHTYVNDPVKNVKGWIGIVWVHEAADQACEMFFPSAVLEAYSKMREHIQSNYVGTPVVVPGGPDKKKEWETFIEQYIADLGMKLCVINLFNYRPLPKDLKELYTSETTLAQKIALTPLNNEFALTI